MRTLAFGSLLECTTVGHGDLCATKIQKSYTKIVAMGGLGLAAMACGSNLPTEFVKLHTKQVTTVALSTE